MTIIIYVFTEIYDKVSHKKEKRDGKKEKK